MNGDVFMGVSKGAKDESFKLSITFWASGDAGAL
jgi:hypothetical protein